MFAAPKIDFYTSAPWDFFTLCLCVPEVSVYVFSSPIEVAKNIDEYFPDMYRFGWIHVYMYIGRSGRKLELSNIDFHTSAPWDFFALCFCAPEVSGYVFSSPLEVAKNID